MAEQGKNKQQANQRRRTVIIFNPEMESHSTSSIVNLATCMQRWIENEIGDFSRSTLHQHHYHLPSRCGQQTTSKTEQQKNQQQQANNQQRTALTFNPERESHSTGNFQHAAMDKERDSGGEGLQGQNNIIGGVCASVGRSVCACGGVILEDVFSCLPIWGGNTDDNRQRKGICKCGSVIIF